MNKLSAHTTLVIFDLLSVYGAYYIFWEWRDLNTLILNQAKSIELQSWVGIYIILLIIPITHISAIVKWQERYNGIVNRVLIVGFAGLILLAGVISIKFTSKVEESNYFYCEKESTQMTFSEFRVFTKTEELCIN